MAKILVTGGLGYIGSHTVVELINAGYEPVIVDDLSNSKLQILDQLSKIVGFKPVFHQFDLCDKQKLIEFTKAEPDIAGIIHFAAFKGHIDIVKLLIEYGCDINVKNIKGQVNFNNIITLKKIKFNFCSYSIYSQTTPRRENRFNRTRRKK